MVGSKQENKQVVYRGESGRRESHFQASSPTLKSTLYAPPTHTHWYPPNTDSLFLLLSPFCLSSFPPVSCLLQCLSPQGLLPAIFCLLPNAKHWVVLLIRIPAHWLLQPFKDAEDSSSTTTFRRHWKVMGGGTHAAACTRAHPYTHAYAHIYAIALPR